MSIPHIQTPKCKTFSGYKPCIPYKNCLKNGCQDDKPENQIGTKILIINLDALGNVLSYTSILPAIKRKFPVSTIHWITMENAKPLLSDNPYIDRIFIWNDVQRMILLCTNYDYLFNADKSEYACAFANMIKATDKSGFLLNEDGKIIPANESALYNYQMGIDDELKFQKNKKTGIEIIHETFDLNYSKDEYIYNFTREETDFIQKYKSKIKYNSKLTYIGLNTGCSTLFPNKKMTIEQHVKLIRQLVKDNNIKIVLLGGKEDAGRNTQILESLDRKTQKKIISTPTDMGIRRGACFIDICDVVITGDSFGMHLAIALKKYVIAWFGLSCPAEIEFYGRGEKLIPEGLACTPCWKKVCPYNLECIKMIDLGRMVKLTKEYSAKKKKAFPGNPS